MEYWGSNPGQKHAREVPYQLYHFSAPFNLLSVSNATITPLKSRDVAKTLLCMAAGFNPHPLHLKKKKEKQNKKTKTPPLRTFI